MTTMADHENGSPMAAGPHVVFLPFPLQGHVKPLFTLAQILADAQIHVTFVSSQNNYNSLLHLAESSAPAIRIIALQDGLPPSRPVRAGGSMNADLTEISFNVTRPLFREALDSLFKDPSLPPPTCVVADIGMYFAVTVAAEFGIPGILFEASCAIFSWLSCNIPKLLDNGIIPFKQESPDMDELVKCIPGFETLIRRRDLPDYLRVADEAFVKFFVAMWTVMKQEADSFIVNTSPVLEPEAIRQLGTVCREVYAVGPFHSTGSNRVKKKSFAQGGLREGDNTCIQWLHSKPSKSVLYVSFGSVNNMAPQEALEFWHGLMNSGSPFLWVIRTDLLTGQAGFDVSKIKEETGKESRGMIVEWCPQEEVLAHPAVGGFLSHCGWNSTIEAIVAGVPSIGWPQHIDQFLITRFVSQEWGVGIEMSEVVYDRVAIERAVRELMEKRKDDIGQNVARLSGLVRASIDAGGSAYNNLEKLIHDIKAMGGKCNSALLASH
uniref:Glycosyltransferase n=1 Tax=Kalanchoe fedtschenkoi TaxID=63787 RepID=A0A7N1A702_KALFE